MATRFQILKKQPDGSLLRANCELVDLDRLVEVAKTDSVWIIVKDRQRRVRQQIWRRDAGVVIDSWWLEE
jgi:hypothetical protein